MYMNDIKLFAKKQKKKRIVKSKTSSEDIQWRYRDGIWHRKMCHAKNEKPKMTYYWRNRATKIRTLGVKETYKYLGILEADTIKQAEMKESFLKNTQ